METGEEITLQEVNLASSEAEPVEIESNGTGTIDGNVSVEGANERLFTKNFFLIWQGQFISALGDVVYGIALGFWVLAVTGSTALMGTLMAASVLPGILVSPFAGVIIDRTDKKRLLIGMDFIRGLAIIFIGIAAIKGFLAIWMVFLAGAILSTCGGFFHPAANAVLPDIVPKSKLTNANAIFGMIFTGSNIIGSSLGGFIYQVLGAPLMFLFNGLSFIFSGSSVAAVNIPKHEKSGQQQHFFTDMKEGFQFVWKFRGLRDVIGIAAILNFFAFIGIVLFLPLFQKTEALGPAKYGVFMAFFSGGMFLGMLITSIVPIPPARKMTIFLGAGLISDFCLAAFPLMGNFSIMCILILIGGLMNSILNVFIMSSVQMSIPDSMRGKVFSLLNMITQGLTPIAMAVGGILGEFFPIKLVIASSFLAVFLMIIPFCFSRDFKRFICFDPKTQVLEDIL